MRLGLEAGRGTDGTCHGQCLPKASIKMKTPAKLYLSAIFVLAGASAAFADTATTTVITTTTPAPVAVAVVRDGFTESYAQVMVTRGGVTKVVQDNMKLRNGIVVRPDGTIVVPGKMNRSLHPGDWLSFDGTLTRADSGRVEHLQPDL
jgi:hypothetical protein